MSLSQRHFGSSRPVISRRLCEKAGKDNAALTKAERMLFLSRLDLYGKMLAYPDSLDAVQFDQACGRPPADVLARTVQAMTGGRLRSIPEVVAAYWAPDDRTGELSYAALETVTMGWWTFDTSEVYAVDDEYEDDAVAAAASALAEAARPQEFAFENAVRAKFLLPETTERDSDEPLSGLEESERTEDELEAMRERHLAELEKRTLQLKQALQAQLEQELRDASAEDLAAIAQLVERMAVEVEEDAKEDEERQREIEELEGQEGSSDEDED